MTGFVAGPQHEGLRLDVALAQHLGSSRSQAAARIAAGEVRVDGRPVGKQHRLRPGESIEVADPVQQPQEPPPPLPPLRYEDEHLLVVAKPAGLVVHRGAGHHGDTLVDALREAGIPLAEAGGSDRPGIVHRLDRDTTGLLIVAKTDAAHAGLVALLRERHVARHYLAVAEGCPRERRGRVEGPIGRDPRNRVRFAVVAGGRPAVTRYEVLEVGALHAEGHRHEVAYLACRLETGRTHQVRVHLSGMGHPLVGDVAYGASRALAQAGEMERPALHAAHVSFRHPITEVRVSVDEPLPADLVQLLTRAGITPPPAEAAGG